MDTLTLEPIGLIRLNEAEKEKPYEYPFQGYSDSLKYTIELFSGHNFEQALEDLEGFSHIWVIFWFHKSKGWNPKSVPPRGPVKKRGVFATRSPYRPNPLGLTLVKLDGIKGRSVFITGGDFMDGTPILDIKPYIGKGDSADKARFGWLEEVEEYKFEVSWQKEAEEKADNLEKENNFELKKYVENTLTYTREPHPYKRIYLEKGRLTLAVKNIRVYFRVEEEKKMVVVEEMEVE